RSVGLDRPLGRPPARRQCGHGTKGRYAPYLRRYRARARRPRIRADGRSRGRTRPRIPMVTRYRMRDTQRVLPWLGIQAKDPNREPNAAGSVFRPSVGWLWVVLAAIVVGGASGCATTGRRAAPPGTSQPDRFLFEKGTDALNQKKWLVAREFFKQVT